MRFLFGTVPKLVGVILIIVAYVLAYFFFLGYEIILPILIAGIVCWIVAYRRAKVSVPSTSQFAAVLTIFAVVGFLIFTGLANYLREIQGGFYPSIIIGAIGTLLGVSGAFISLVQQRTGGILLTIGPGLGLLSAIFGDQLTAAMSILWWGVPMVLGLVFLMKKRDSISKKTVAVLSFVSVLLPWFTVWEWDWYPTGVENHATNYFLFGVVVRDAGLQYLNYVFYLGIVPLILVLTGSTIFLRSLMAKASDAVFRKRSVQSGIMLMVASAISGTFLFLLSVVLFIFGGRYSQAGGFASAGCWLAFLTGTVMIAPLSFNITKEEKPGLSSETGREPVSIS